MDDQENRASGDGYEPRISDLTALLSLVHEVITSDVIWAPAWQAVLGRGDLFSDGDEDKLRTLLHDAVDYYGSAVQGYAQIAPIMDFITAMGGTITGMQVTEKPDGEQIQVSADTANYL